MCAKDIDDLEVSPEDVETLLATGHPDAELVDVREDWELARGILPGAVHVPLSSFEDHLDHWQPGRRYVIYCEHGVRSLDVAAWLAQRGLDAKSMRGGFAIWHGPVSSPGADQP